MGRIAEIVFTFKFTGVFSRISLLPGVLSPLYELLSSNPSPIALLGYLQHFSVYLFQIPDYNFRPKILGSKLGFLAHGPA
jgi:hypothetical protein